MDKIKNMAADPVFRQMTVGQIRAALRISGIEPDEVRQQLRVAQKEGFDPRGLYEEATANRPPRWQRAPAYEEVAPA